MSDDTDWFNQYDNDQGDNSDEQSRPPIWVVIVIAVSLVAGGWLLFTQDPRNDDPVASPTTTVEASVVETTTTSAVTTTTSAAAGGSVSDVGNRPATVTSQTPRQLRGYVAVASPDAPSSQNTVWVLRPGGSVVSRSDAVIRDDDADYPILITAGHLIVGDRIFDLDLAEPPISLWTDASVYPGSGPGVVWLAQHAGFRPADWVAQVDVESLTVGDQVTDVSFFPLVGLADGLIVVDFNHEGHLVWSPTGEPADVDLPDELGAILAASGNLVVTRTSDGVDVIDIRRSGSVSSFELPGFLTSACLSPDGQHVIIVGRNGEAVVGNITSGAVIGLNMANGDQSMEVARKHGIGWTADDQLVFIAGDGDTKHILGFDIATNDPFYVATLDGSKEWWLTASGTMC